MTGREPNESNHWKRIKTSGFYWQTKAVVLDDSECKHKLKLLLESGAYELLPKRTQLLQWRESSETPLKIQKHTSYLVEIQVIPLS